MTGLAVRARAAGAVAGLAFIVGACAADEETAQPAKTLASAPLDVPAAKDSPPADPDATTTSSPTGGGSGGPSGDLGVDTSFESCPKDRWCSALYPPGWKANAPADSQGRFLHDFSYAGYRSGEAPPISPPGGTYDVVATYGADASGVNDATAAIQAAIDAASRAGGGVVYLPSGTYRVAGRLYVSESNVVLRGAGTSSHLRFTKTTGMAGGANLTFAGSVSRDPQRALTVDGNERDEEVTLANVSGLAPGDDVAIGWTITGAFVADHGMTGTWTAFANQYQVFFRSKVVAISGNKVQLDVPLRYRALVRDGAALQKETGYIHDVGLEHVAVSNAVTWATAWAENQVSAISFKAVRDGWIDDVHSVVEPTASPYHLRSHGISIESSKRVSVLGSSMENPQNRGEAGNGYLFQVSRTNDVLFADSVAKNGRHNFIQNWGFGNVGTVFLRCVSSGGGQTTQSAPTSSATLYSEHHHSLAMATLVDDSRFDDGWASMNRGSMSTGAGHTSTGGVVWRAAGSGKVISRNFGWGYVVGTKKGVTVDTNVSVATGAGTAPEDFVEGKDQGDTLFPSSLYEHQRARRLAGTAK